MKNILNISLVILIIVCVILIFNTGLSTIGEMISSSSDIAVMLGVVLLPFYFIVIAFFIWIASKIIKNITKTTEK